MSQSGLRINRLFAACGGLALLVLASWTQVAHASSTRASVGVRMMVPQKVTVEALPDMRLTAGKDMHLCIGGNAQAGRYSIRVDGQPASAGSTISLPGTHEASCAPAASQAPGAAVTVPADFTRHLQGNGAAVTLVVVAE